eukprot:TRINITY_DN10637_c2_g1_i1.p1 TRINITY_DN10637_c2_g1~~TRINITY_DN10637_c2_g1_i1.p1  ORF type:complete len:181 (+),score=23.44 TRINITY_DN10637_c2_g1_i1:97-639(+)
MAGRPLQVLGFAQELSSRIQQADAALFEAQITCGALRLAGGIVQSIMHSACSGKQLSFPVELSLEPPEQYGGDGMVGTGGGIASTSSSAFPSGGVCEDSYDGGSYSIGANAFGHATAVACARRRSWTVGGISVPGVPQGVGLKVMVEHRVCAETLAQAGLEAHLDHLRGLIEVSEVTPRG